MAHYFLDARIEEGLGDKRAVVVGDNSWTYAETQALANQLAGVLAAHDIGAEDRVLLLLPDGMEFVASWFGILKAGGVFCMGNPMVTAEDFDYLLGYTKARAVIAHANTLDRLGQVIGNHPRCKLRLCVGEAWGGSSRQSHVRAPSVTTTALFADWHENVSRMSTEFANAETSRDDVAGWLFTSGTTGKPKGAVHLHHDFPFNTECYAKSVLRLRSSDVFVSVSRLFFGYATGTNLMFPFAVGGTAVLFPEKPTAEVMFEQVQRHGVTVLTNVPAMIRMMLDSPMAPSVDLSSVRICLSAGEALPPELHARWLTRWPNADLLDGIGSAELFHIYITNYPGEAVPGSLGKLVPGYQAQIVSALGEEMPAGEIGKLRVRGDSAAICYWGDHEKSKATFSGDWVTSADLFRKEENGYFYYAGRDDDMLKVRGIFVGPLEIEDCLATHPGVLECAVAGAPDADGLTIPKAFVVLREGWAASEETSKALEEYVRNKLAHYKCPRAFHFMSALPRNDRGKVLRRELK